MKEKVEAGDDKPLDMLILLILGGGNAFDVSLTALFITVAACTVLLFLMWYSLINSGTCTLVASCQLS
jgi:hypothetical protein